MALKTKSDFAYIKDKPSTLLFRDKRTGYFLTTFMIRGRRYLLSTGLKDPKCAQEKAYNRYLKIYMAAEDAPVVAKRLKIPSVGQVAELYLAEIVEYSGQKVALKSATGYVNAFRQFVGIIDSKNPDSVLLSDISPDTLRAFRAKKYADKGLDFSKDKNLILNYSINSYVTNALSVFSERALRLYRSKKWEIPASLLSLKNEAPLPQKKPDFLPIPEEIDSKMIRLAAAALSETYPADEDYKFIPPSQVAVIFELARFCSLTSSEIQNIRWNWFEDSDTKIRIAGSCDFSTKRNAKDRRIPVDAARVARWKKALGYKINSSEFVIFAQSKTERLNITARDANAWIGQFIPERKKKLHELRKMCTSDFLRATNGDVFNVADIIGDDPRTMLKYYAAVLKPDVDAL